MKPFGLFFFIEKKTFFFNIFFLAKKNVTNLDVLLHLEQRDQFWDDARCHQGLGAGLVLGKGHQIVGGRGPLFGRVL